MIVSSSLSNALNRIRAYSPEPQSQTLNNNANRQRLSSLKLKETWNLLLKRLICMAIQAGSLKILEIIDQEDIQLVPQIVTMSRSEYGLPEKLML